LARRTLVFAALLIALAAAVIASLALGAVKIPFAEVIDIVFGNGGSDIDRQIVETLRLPRTVEAMVVGAALGIAGAVLQGALANPLASPDVIGVTGGAGFGAILAGIAILSLFTAATTGLLAAYPERAPSAIFFIAGGLTSSGWDELRTIWPYFAVGFLFALFLIRPLDRLALGDDVAASLGSRPHLIRLGAAVSAALLAAASAAIAGLLGFLGLVVPHVVRMAGGTSSHTFVVPASAIGGAALLAGADTLARTIRAPIEMPVGPFMVLLGVPLFLWLLRKVVA
jgi:iron complex transport system permease protein